MLEPPSDPQQHPTGEATLPYIWNHQCHITGFLSYLNFLFNYIHVLFRELSGAISSEISLKWSYLIPL